MVPNGWGLKSLESISKIIDCKHRTPKYVESGVPLVSPGSIKWGAIDLISPKKRVSKDEYVSLMDHCTVNIGDLVLSRNQSVGVAAFVENDDPFVLGQDTVLVKPTEADSKFLFYNLQSVETQRTIFKLAGGSTFSRINLGDIRKLKAIYPPLPEQRKIASILGTWDKAISTTERLIDNSKQQKKALMQQLLTGKKRLLDDSGKPFEGEWKRVELGKLLDYKQPTPYLVKSTEYSNEYPTPVLTAGKTFILGYSNEDFGIFSEELPAIIFDDFTTASKFVDFPFKAKSSAMKILVAKDGVSIKYIYEAMQVLNYPVGGHQRHWISIFANLVIGLPSPEEQQKIAAVLTNADKEVELLEQQLADLKQEKKALMQQLLTGKRRVIV
jgi:type I restriction enzyme S subunit